MEELILQAEILMSSFFFTREYLSATWVLLFNFCWQMAKSKTHLTPKLLLEDLDWKINVFLNLKKFKS